MLCFWFASFLAFVFSFPRCLDKESLIRVVMQYTKPRIRE